MNCGLTRDKFFVLFIAIEGGLVNEGVSCFEVVVSRSRKGGAS